jgi:hypothetical protein
MIQADFRDRSPGLNAGVVIVRSQFGLVPTLFDGGGCAFLTIEAIMWLRIVRSELQSALVGKNWLKTALKVAGFLPSGRQPKKRDLPQLTVAAGLANVGATGFEPATS